MIALLAGLLSVSLSAAAAEGSCPPDRQSVQVMDETGTWDVCQLADGTRDGPATLRRYDGSLAARGDFDDGERSGEWRFYSRSGGTEQAGRYTGGQRTGVWSTFSPDGEIAATVTWWGPSEPRTRRRAPPDRRLTWSRQLGAAARSVTPVADALLVEHGRTWTLLDADSGAERWSVALPAALRPGLAASTDRLAAITGPGEVLVVELASGMARRIRTNLGATNIVDIAAGGIIVREGAGRIEALDPVTGGSRWRTKLASDTVAPVVVSPGVVAIVRGRDVRALRLDRPDSVVWQARLDHSVAQLAAGWGGQRIYALDQRGELVALGAATGRPQWSALLPGVAGRAAGVSLRDDTHSLVVGTGDRLLAYDRDGRTRADDPLPKEAALGGDLLGDLRCFASRDGELRCGSARLHTVEWTLPTGPLSHAPVVLGDAVVVATADGRLLWVDAALAAASEESTPDDARVLDPALPLLLDYSDGSFGMEGVAATAPLLELVRPTPQAGCRRHEALLDLGRATLDATGLAWDAADLRTVAVPVLAIDETSLDAPAAVDDELWEIEDRGRRWSVAYWTEWRPQLREMAALGDDAAAAAEVDRLLRCEGPPARFEGTAVLQDGLVERRIAGRISARPVPHVLDGLPGCLIDLSLAGEPLGTWSSPSLPGWVELGLTLDDRDGGDASELALPPVGVAGFPDGSVDGRLEIDALLPGASERERLSLDGALWLERPLPWEPSPSADPGDLVVYDGEAEALRLPADGLIYAEIGVHADGEDAPVVSWTSWVRLRGREATSPSQSRFMRVWSVEVCDDADGAPALSE